MLKNTLFFIFAQLFSVSLFSQTNERKIFIADSIYYSNPDESFNLCIEVQENETDKTLLLKSKLCIARYYLLKADLDESGKLLNEVIELCNTEKDNILLATAYKQKSNILDRIGQKEQGIEYLEKAIETFLIAKDTIGANKCKINAVIRYIEFGELNKAYKTLTYLSEKDKFLDEKQSYFINQNWGKYYLAIKEPHNALPKLLTALSVAEKLKMIDSQATIWLIISNTYFELKNITEAQKAIENSIRISIENNLMHEHDEALEFLIVLLEKSGKYKEAFLAQKEKKEIEQKIYDIERINKINYYDKKLQLLEHQRSIVEKDLQLQEHKFDLDKSSLMNKVMTVVIILVVFILAAIIWFTNKTRKLNTELNTQKKSLEKQNAIIADAYFNIKSSISYAKRIQEAILPPDSFIKKLIDDYFILYLPKDIVAGDFYWIQDIGEDEISFAVADCTGHGVPGAMVSVVSHNALNRAIREFGLKQPSLILDKVNELVETAFNTNSEHLVNDGMDIAICCLNKKTLELQYAGANNPMWIIKPNGFLNELRADKQPIGYFKDRKKFTNQSITLEKGDTIILFSDGYADQFGGFQQAQSDNLKGKSGNSDFSLNLSKTKKYTYKRLREKLISLSNQSPNNQKNTLEKEFNDWKGATDQVDDVCILSIKI
jgi:serine phosphatase RsbU (regulator of sigma subunit)